MYKHLQKRLETAQNMHLKRNLQVIDHRNGIFIEIEGQKLVNFSSNDYLGLSCHPKVISALKTSAAAGIGSTASVMVCGYSKEQQYLEAQLKDFLGYPRVLLFNSGYMANLAIISTLANKDSTVYMDKLAHASLIDATTLSQARRVRFRHNDITHLKNCIIRELSSPTSLMSSTGIHASAPSSALILSEGLFSMDGEVCPIQSLIQTSKDHQIPLVIDDAHGFGVLGKKGQGILSGHPSSDISILMGTFSKAIGTMGAFVATDEQTYDYLLQFARPYIYTTALPPCILAATSQSLHCLQEEPSHRERLQDNIHYFQEQAINLGIYGDIRTSTIHASSPIQVIHLASAQRASQISTCLQEKGYLAYAMRPPTVPAGTSRLRVTLSALHQKWMIRDFLEILVSLLENETK